MYVTKPLLFSICPDAGIGEVFHVEHITCFEMQLIRAVAAPRMVGHKASLFIGDKKSCDICPSGSLPL
jgi:hypothetical protein